MSLGRMAYRLSLLWFVIWTTTTTTTFTLPTVAAAQTTNVTPEILNFVPTCAQNCFKSFIAGNFDNAVCGDAPSLQCLCRQLGASGYTIGEGAASCMAGEGQFGACQDEEDFSGEVDTAYNMCIGVSRSQPRTHKTLEATLILPSSETGPVVAPSTTKTGKSTSTRAHSGISASTTAPIPVFTLPSGDTTSSTRPRSTALPTSTTSSSSASTTVDPVSTGDATSVPATGQDSKKLNSAQVTGIALGCAAVLVLGILLMLLARYIRRRRFGDLESGSGFARMRDSMSFKKKGRRDSGPEMGMGIGGPQISSPLPRIQHQSPRNPMNPGWTPTIPRGYQGAGLPASPAPAAARGGVFARPSPALASVIAASRPPTPPRKPTPTTSPASVRGQAAPALGLVMPAVPKLVFTPSRDSNGPQPGGETTKPALTLAIPKAQGAPVRPARSVPDSSRDSVVTEFAEDGEADAGGQRTSVWRPPPSDPQSATTVYFADKGGNWILRNSSTREPGAVEGTGVPPVPAIPTGQPTQTAAAATAELPSPQQKTRAELARDAYGGFAPDAVVSPLRLPRKPDTTTNRKLSSPIAFQDRRREPQVTSPTYSARLSQTAETVISEESQVGIIMPGTAISGSGSGSFYTIMHERESRDLTGLKGNTNNNNRRRSTKRTNRRVSQGSVTSIESGGEEEDENIARDDGEQRDLTPVAESPHPSSAVSPAGKSPVTYPRIHHGPQRPGGSNKAQVSPLLPTKNGSTGGSDLGHVAQQYNVWRPSGQPSPTGEGLGPNSAGNSQQQQQYQQQHQQPYNGPVRRPWNAPASLNPNPNPNRNPAQLRTGSPETRTGNVPPAAPHFFPGGSQEALYWQRQRQVANPASYWNQSSQGQGQRHSRVPRPRQQQQYQQKPVSPMGPYELPAERRFMATEQQRLYQQQGYSQYQQPQQPYQQQQQYQQQQHQPYHQHHSQATIYPPTPVATPQPQQPQPTPPQQQQQPTGPTSLLAQRRGADKVTALTLTNPKNKQAGSDGKNPKSQTTKSKNGWTREEGGEPAAPPITPGWMPELTPTRKGGDLYLNVR
ncbi:uncharacterized protein C8A04DRAFT_14202 [Dichotomopilus funicola]|uniref:Uncharacterized protein n=1 Tax=Dichotomopilus funicola TaxID=1934379 RepID=A0AAN6UZF7_9PEZI|nr:hypothetical protein C8A04DRAFT_14202 [Dichotomopilus funicola]